MSNLVDTLLNIWTFGFIAVLVWIWVRPMPEKDGE